MNKKIKQLALQAGAEFDWDPGTSGPEVYFNQQEDFEKFAELIVRECARIIDRGDGEMSSIAETLWCNSCRDHILIHFGVEK